MSKPHDLPELNVLYDPCKRCQTALLSRLWWLLMVVIVVLCGLAGLPFDNGVFSEWVAFVASGLLGIGVISGLAAMQRHVGKFQEFGFVHVLDGRIDAMVYILLSFSTALCFFALVVRTVWSWDMGWGGWSEGWKVVVLLVDISVGGVSTALHLLISKILSSGLWDQCKRL